jgi:hypothetical protein
VSTGVRLCSRHSRSRGSMGKIIFPHFRRPWHQSIGEPANQQISRAIT